MSTPDILIRASLTDNGDLPRTGDVSDSPDVIPYQTLVDDPISFFISNYDENVNEHLKASVDNFIYVRGKNLAATLQQGDIYLYYALDSQLDTPAKWTKNALQSKLGNYYVRVSAQSQDNIVVTEDPFVWNPPVPGEGDTYSLIGILVAKGTKPDFSKVTDFEKYVDDNNNIGWTKVIIDKPVPPPIPGRRWKTTFAYVQGATARQMNFSLQCNAIPTGSYVSFFADNNVGPDPAIFLDKTKISDPNGSYGIASQVPAGYAGNVSFEFLYDGTPPVDSSITFVASYLEGSGNGPKKTIVVASVKTAN
ncbi:hypothetical protein [Mucilaginibacter sp.]|uniref:hypothetical protein n=1 Tax=Mucilaginibacter sp. TaxID=1882438 RepID=UPI00284E20FC|nr:hypothetical protein [Mucilaginibacter sp.]MDR3693759.1 hypothetical protein [Mucilaginibacter sp.]